jgi:ABC-type Na+ efflux pump permease subunit
MTQYIKAVHGNVAAGGKYFLEGMSTSVEDELATSVEVKLMVDKGYLKVFPTLVAAQNHTFKSMSEKFKAGEDIKVPSVNTAAKTAEEDKKKQEELAKATKLAEEEKAIADAKVKSEAAKAELAAAEAAKAAELANPQAPAPVVAPVDTTLAPTTATTTK